jgi:VanZ family protein
MRLIEKSLGRKTLLLIVSGYSLAVTLAFLMPTQLFAENKTLTQIQIPYLDKWIHSLLFFILMYLWQWYFYKKKANFFSTQHSIILFLALMFYGIIIEILQGLMPISRTADILDVFADMFGALLGVLAFKTFKHKFHS